MVRYNSHTEALIFKMVRYNSHTEALIFYIDFIHWLFLVDEK